MYSETIAGNTAATATAIHGRFTSCITLCESIQMDYEYVTIAVTYPFKYQCDVATHK